MTEKRKGSENKPLMQLGGHGAKDNVVLLLENILLYVILDNIPILDS